MPPTRKQRTHRNAVLASIALAALTSNARRARGFLTRSVRYTTNGSRCRSIKDHPSFKDRRQ